MDAAGKRGKSDVSDGIAVSADQCPAEARRQEVSKLHASTDPRPVAMSYPAVASNPYELIRRESVIVVSWGWKTADRICASPLHKH